MHTTVNLKIIGLRLKTLRKQTGLSRREISERYGISIATIATWEQGEKEMGVLKLLKYVTIFQNLGIEIDLNILVNGTKNLPLVFIE